MNERDALAYIASLPEPERAQFAQTLTADEVAYLESLLPASTVEYVNADSPLDLAHRLHPGWRTRTHLQLLSDKLVETATRGGRLIVSLPPQHGKSQLVARWGPAWYLDRWPGRRVILTSYAEALIRDRSREVRDTLTTATGLHAQVARGTATQWDTTDGGGLLAAGIRGTVTGFGANLFVIDDPFADWEEAHSRAARDRVWNFWRAVAYTRLAPGAAVIVCQTRWHHDDLVGRLTSADYEGDPDEWDVLRIPALAEDDDPLGRDEGEPLLRPDVDDTVEAAGERLETIRRALGPYLWSGLYQQRPSAEEGTIFERGWWQFYRTDPGPNQAPPRPGGTIWADGQALPIDEMAQVASWDMSFKEAAGSSWVVGQVWGRHPSRPADRWLLDQVRARMGFSATKKAVVRMDQAWPRCEARWVEDKANGPAVVDELRRTVGMSEVTPQGSKESRAWSCQGDVEAGNVWLPSPGACPWVAGFVDELADFPDGQHDDQVDAFTQALLKLRSRRPVAVRSPQGRLPTSAGRARLR